MLGIFGETLLQSLIFFDPDQAHLVNLECATSPVKISEKKISRQSFYFLNYLNSNPNSLLKNMLAMKKIGITNIIHFSQSSSINPAIKVGDFAFITNFFNYNDQTPATFSNQSLRIKPAGFDQKNQLFKYLETKLLKKGTTDVHLNITLGATGGERELSRQEIHFLSTLDCGVISKNIGGYPYLANQIGLGYCHISLVSKSHRLDQNALSADSHQHAQIIIQLLKNIAGYPLPYFDHMPFTTQTPFSALTKTWLSALKND